MKSRGGSEKQFILGRGMDRKSVILIEGSQASAARPSDPYNVRLVRSSGLGQGPRDLLNGVLHKLKNNFVA